MGGCLGGRLGQVGLGSPFGGRVWGAVWGRLVWGRLTGAAFGGPPFGGGFGQYEHEWSFCSTVINLNNLKAAASTTKSLDFILF